MRRPMLSHVDPWSSLVDTVKVSDPSSHDQYDMTPGGALSTAPLLVDAPRSRYWRAPSTSHHATRRPSTWSWKPQTGPGDAGWTADGRIPTEKSVPSHGPSQMW